ncbi:Calmodulin-binding domain, plant [Sesbania bispinosa]|nr:Calmodulin-binding domain, plant [Sesbania bispinosa]
MINQKVETEGSYSNYDAKSQSVFGAEESVSSQPERTGRLESKKKIKKVRSIRLHRLSSMRSSTRGWKPHDDNLSILSSDGTESSGHPTSIGMADGSPNYMKATSSSHAKDGFQSTQRLFTKKSLTRMSTLKLKKNLTRKLSGRTEPKRKLKSSRSIKVATMKGSKGKLSESMYGIDGQNRKNTIDAGNKSQRVLTRRLTLKPVRILTKMSTFKSKNSSMEKGPLMSQSPDSSLHKATCSSTLKDSHFRDHIDLPQDGSDSQVVPAMKVCTYSYCSLHGHRHGNLPPLKRFVSMRRRVLKSQKSMKMDGRSKQFGNARKATQKTKTVHSEDGSSHFQNVKKLARDSCVRPHDTPASTVTEGGTSLGEDEEKYNFRCNAEVLLGETSFPHLINFEEYLGNSPAVESYTSLAVKETNIECCCIATEEEKSDPEVTETAGNDKNMAACKMNDESVTVESTLIDVAKFSGSDIETLEGEVTTEGKNMEPDYEVLQKSSVEGDLKPASTADVKMQERDQKYIKMWQLMYKHAVLSNTGKSENKVPLDGKDKEGRGQDAIEFNAVDSSSCDNNCETDQDMDDENKNVIELVQKAFDEILLPEAEDLSSDDHFKSRGIGSNEVLPEKSESTTEERNASTSTESPKEAQRMGAKPDQRTPKSWSNLKKLLLLKRFVKALEKKKSFSSTKQQKREKKLRNGCLDYALQKVISKLAPAQRQRVTLLIEAFETVLPFQDAENGSQTSATVEPQTNPIQCLDNSSGQSKEETDRGRDYGYSAKILLRKALSSHNSTMEFSDNAGDNPMPELHNPIVLKERYLEHPGTKTPKNMPASGAIEDDLNGNRSSADSYDNGEKISIDNDNIYHVEIEDSRSHSLCKPGEIISSCHEEAPSNVIAIANEVPGDLISNLNTENPNIKSDSTERDFESKNVIGDDREELSMSKSSLLNGLVRSLRSNLVGSGAPSNLLDESTVDRTERTEKAKLGTDTSEELPTHQQSETPKSAVVGPEPQPEKQSYAGLWFMVYKHMVSDMTENNSKSLNDGADEKESGYEGSRTRGSSITYESTHVIDQDHSVTDPEVELHKIEAIKMVEEAIDSILPDDQDHLPDRQSLTQNTILDNSEQSNRTERMYSEGLNQKKKGWNLEME